MPEIDSAHKCASQFRQALDGKKHRMPRNNKAKFIKYPICSLLLAPGLYFLFFSKLEFRTRGAHTDIDFGDIHSIIGVVLFLGGLVMWYLIEKYKIGPRD